MSGFFLAVIPLSSWVLTVFRWLQAAHAMEALTRFLGVLPTASPSLFSLSSAMVAVKTNTLLDLHAVVCLGWDRKHFWLTRFVWIIQSTGWSGLGQARYQRQPLSVTKCTSSYSPTLVLVAWWMPLCASSKGWLKSNSIILIMIYIAHQGCTQHKQS